MSYPMSFPPQGVVAAAAMETVLPAYTVYRENATYYAVNNSTGIIDFNGADPAVVVQACLTAGGAGTVVGMREAHYMALTGVAATALNQGVYGLGEGTYWDATALATGTHAFTISGFTGCEFRNFAIETNAGGGLVNHGIFIEDGADDFHLIDLTIVDSDSDGIHVEGTTITQGHIHRCHVVAADGAGILVDMDAANFMYRLHVEGCDIGACGTIGIEFATSGGNFYCEIVNNVVSGCTSDGISVIDGDYSMIRGNICTLNGESGIYVGLTEHAQFLGNVCRDNTFHGIETATGTLYDTFVGNTCTENTRHGMFLNGADDSVVVGNSCWGNGWHGIHITSAMRSAVTGNYCSVNTWSGISSSGSNNCTLTGNVCEINTRHGIYLESSDGWAVTGNTCWGNDWGNSGTYDGIYINICDRMLVVGNNCQANDRWGIMVNNDSNWNKISNNYTNGNTAGSINVNGAVCDNNQVEFNTVEEGAPVDTGTLTRSYGNYDPSADAFVGNVGVAPW